MSLYSLQRKLKLNSLLFTTNVSVLMSQYTLIYVVVGMVPDRRIGSRAGSEPNYYESGIPGWQNT